MGSMKYGYARVSTDLRLYPQVPGSKRKMLQIAWLAQRIFSEPKTPVTNKTPNHLNNLAPIPPKLPHRHAKLQAR